MTLAECAHDPLVTCNPINPRHRVIYFKWWKWQWGSNNEMAESAVTVKTVANFWLTVHIPGTLQFSFQIEVRQRRIIGLREKGGVFLKWLHTVRHWKPGLFYISLCPHQSHHVFMQHNLSLLQYLPPGLFRHRIVPQVNLPEWGKYIVWILMCFCLKKRNPYTAYCSNRTNSTSKTRRFLRNVFNLCQISS